MKGGLGNMPLTLWVIVAAVILYLYLRRANLGIDTHPGEGKSVTIPRPTVLIPRSQGDSPPVLPPIPDWVAKQFPVTPQPAPSIQPMPGTSGGGVMQ